MQAVNKAVVKGEYPSIAAPIPAPNASSAKANPNRMDSFREIIPDLSKSASFGRLSTVLTFSNLTLDEAALYFLLCLFLLSETWK